MVPIRSVLAATDFSHSAAAAVARAALVAAEHQAELKLVHVVEQAGLTVLRDWLAPGRDLRSAIAAQAEMQLSALAQQILGEQHVAPQTLLRVGEPLAELNAAANGADLVVLGARGNHRLRELAVGTTADRLLRTAARPLLVAKTVPAGSYRRVLVLVDFSPASDAAVHAALRLAPRAAIHLLHVFDVPYEGKLRIAGVGEEEIGGYRAQARDRAMQDFRRLLPRTGAGTRSETSIEHGDVRLQFLRAAEVFQPDLIAVGKQGQGFVADLLLGSVTRVVLAEARCDVLVVPRGAQA